MVLALFAVFYHKLFAITFDENFARATGVKAGLYNMLIAFLTAVTIVLGMRMMGAMLISSLIVFPALSSMRIFKKFRSVTISSAFISILCFFTGIIISYVYATPTGASIVILNIVVFLVFLVVENVLNGKILPRARTAALFLVLIPVLGAPLLSGCGNSPGPGAQKNNAGTLSVSLDLPAENGGADAPAKHLLDPADRNMDGPVVEIKEKMFIAQVNDVYLNAEDYLGKTLKLEGIFKEEKYAGIETPYFFVIRYGPGCCGFDSNAGFEVAWDKEIQDRPYPGVDEWVAAEGKLSYYEEDGYPYLYIALSSLETRDKRGAEYVSQ
jgi:hypothetical protein